MTRIKLEDIVFWILIAIIIAIVIWILSGSPALENSLPSLITLVIASEILLWKALFSIDKKTSNGFIKIKNDMNNIRKDISNLRIELRSELKEIKNIIKKR